MSSPLRFDVYVAPPALLTTSSPEPLSFSPISCTLIQGEKEAVLVDTPLTAAQATALADWIEKTAPRKRLTTLYVTHGHGDHFFGAPVLQKRFPGLRILATAGTIEHMKASYSPEQFDGVWSAVLPGQLAEGRAVADQLPANGEFQLEGHTLRAVEVGHSDMDDTTVLYVPELKLVVAGDVVYGDCYQYFGLSGKKEQRIEWLAALDKVAALEPEFIVPGHKKVDQGVDAGEHLKSTREYIEAFEEEVGKATDAAGLEAVMIERFPNRIGLFILKFTCDSLFPAK